MEYLLQQKERPGLCEQRLFSVVESRSRSLAKACSYRLLGSTITAIIASVFTNGHRISVGVAIADFIVKTVAYFVHERIWLLVPNRSTGSVSASVR